VSEGLQRVEKELLHLRLMGKELNVIQKQDVHVLKPLLYCCLTLHSGCSRKIPQELLRSLVFHPFVRVNPFHMPGDGPQDVGFAKSRGSIDEQRIVAHPRPLGCPSSGGRGQPVGRPHHEVVEGELRI
jgi:hypothetical protein